MNVQGIQFKQTKNRRKNQNSWVKRQRKTRIGKWIQAT